MAELLNVINSYINKYRIEDVINKKIAIRVPDIKDLDAIQNKLETFDYKELSTIDEDDYYTYDETCIEIRLKYDNEQRKTIRMLYAYKSWYEQNEYKVISMDDLLL